MLLTSCLGSISSKSWRLLRGSGSLVDLRLFLSWSRWPLTVASTFGRCLGIKLVVSLGQEVKCLRLIARRKVLGAGLKHAPLKYWANYILVLSTLMMTFTEGEVWRLVEVGAGFLEGRWRLDVLLDLLRGILHSPWLFLGPLIMALLFLIMLRSYFVNNEIQSSSHSWPMETKEPVLRESKMKACWAFGVNSGAKPHVVWRIGVMCYHLLLLLLDHLLKWCLDRKVELPLSGSWVLLLCQQGRS